MVCIHCLSIFGFILAVLYEIIKKTFGISFEGLLRKGNPAEEGAEPSQPKGRSCPYVPPESAATKEKVQ